MEKKELKSQVHGMAMGTKWRLLSPISSCQKLKQKCFMKAESSQKYGNDVLSLWDVNKQDIDLFIEQANTFYPTIKFTAEISDKEITFLDTVVYKGERFLIEAILDVKTHYKLTETFQYTHYSSSHPQKKVIRLLRRNSSEKHFQETMTTWSTWLPQKPN